MWSRVQDVSELLRIDVPRTRIEQAIGREETELEQLDIIAHSRGTDVVTAALRELFMVSRAGGGEPLDEFRIRNLALAAPDLDYDVLRQRLSAERIATGIS